MASIFKVSYYEQLGLVYALIILYISINYLAPDVNNLYRSDTISSSSSPLIGRFNASDQLFKRFNELQVSFEDALNERAWTTLRASSSEGIIIERLDGKDKSWPPYIR